MCAPLLQAAALRSRVDPRIGVTPSATPTRRRTRMTENRNGRVVTFYSYKGGTGRTMALANVAWILAATATGYSPSTGISNRPACTVSSIPSSTWPPDSTPGRHRPGHRLPGLGRPGGRPPTGTGLARVRRYAISFDWRFPAGGGLDLLRPGAGTVSTPPGQPLRLGRLLRPATAAAVFVPCGRPAPHYDYVLIDSRTGLSDTADICTVQLPARLVAASPSAPRASTAPRGSPGTSTNLPHHASASCRCRCGSTRVRRRKPTPGGRWPGSAGFPRQTGEEIARYWGRGDPVQAVLRVRGDTGHLRRRGRPVQLDARRLRAAHLDDQ